MTKELTHFNEQGRAHMVDVSDKQITQRTATAYARITMLPETLTRIREGKMAKGDVLGVAQVAGIMAAKKTSDIIPMCHPLPLTKVDIRFEERPEENALDIYGTCRVTGVTGVEMEALTAVSVSALTVYDMCKAIDKGMVISNICLLEKTGGKSGDYRRGNI
ncbi:cyclic pyranopterin monophosphate synthase MoaC [Effusibacillus lacus]|uniref:Cyclic pyranopterin monophosphate synthase n=1 Tax=Effusibacillus lacus TaxID=1348429 RepID=A0A292YT09_9BACL|nr:cyclic pyranopterin monophosphate synthase MoaC [Effusibacillus lacus]TCS76361.1 cyclic pyranopterin phosphate synthase [Effusibacillus lacus]GAX91903.1 cyclic pyranopterin monophosphate synthase MoaC [Effusibacillus lacus]